MLFHIGIRTYFGFLKSKVTGILLSFCSKAVLLLITLMSHHYCWFRRMHFSICVLRRSSYYGIANQIFVKVCFFFAVTQH